MKLQSLSETESDKIEGGERLIQEFCGGQVVGLADFGPDRVKIGYIVQIVALLTSRRGVEEEKKRLV